MIRKFAASFIALVLLSLTTVFAQRATPPSQPASGPGGKQYAHSRVTKNRYGTGNQEYWVFEPDTPKPASAPLIVFLHGWGGMNPLYYGAWLDHLVRSEEHTSELQSQSNLVCRLLLEKKKYRATYYLPDATPSTCRTAPVHASLFF